MVNTPFTLEDTRYEIIDTVDEETGRYKGRRTDSGALVTLKLIKKADIAELQPERARQLGDAHDNIMPILDAGTTSDYYYVAMPHFNAETLADALTLAMEVDQTITILSTVAKALDFAHEQGVVHGALSPDSILLDPKGRLYVRDFVATAPSPRYAAPETFEARALPQSDQYALAVIAFQTLTDGQYIFPITDSTPELIEKHRHEAPRRLTTARPDLPAGMDDVLQKGLAKAPNDRYPTVWAFVRALENAFRSDPSVVKRERDHMTDSYVTEPPEREDKWWRAWLPWIAVGTAVVIGAVLLLILA